MNEPAKLKRSLGLPMITFYGLGTIVGGGFYALLGRVAGEAGMLTPLAVLVAAAIAMFSAFSYAELSARYPVSAGEAHYVLAAFRRLWPSAVVGWAVVATGVVSAATLAAAFAGFVRTLVDLPDWLLVCVMVIGLGLVAAWGISESATMALVITVIELGGLIIVVVVGSPTLATLPDRLPELVPDFSFAAWSGILMGAYLAFYSFVGFEDMVNVAEEVKQPSRNLPIAIMLALGLSAVLYGAVSLTVVLAVPRQELIESHSPLSLVLGKGTRGATALTYIAILAGLNGALVQIVMASRVVYGMATKYQAPRVFAGVNPVTQTPLVATISITLVVMALALWFPIESLAKATSTILLMIYAAVNLSLIVIKRRDGAPPEEGPSYPLWLPIAGCCTCLGFLAFHATSVWVLR